MSNFLESLNVTSLDAAQHAFEHWRHYGPQLFKQCLRCQNLIVMMKPTKYWPRNYSIIHFDFSVYQLNV